MTKKQAAKPMGRPTKFTEGVREKILQGIRMGATYELSCNYAGISYQTFLNWKAKAEEDEDSEYVDFFESITRAEGEAAFKWLVMIEKHASANPQWAAWKLERRYPKIYGRTVAEQEHSGELKINVEYVKPRVDNT